MTEANVFEIIHASNFLQLNILEDICADFLEEKLSCKNVGELTKKAMEFGAKKSIETCLEYFGRNASEILNTQEFLQLPYEALLMLCSCRNVDCTQLELFQSCVSWAAEECVRKKNQPTPENMRKKLGQILSKIQFASMELKHLLEIVIPMEILPFEEVGRIIVKKVKKEKKKVQTKKSVDGNQEIKVKFTSL